jgi:hypothetical protein
VYASPMYDVRVYVSLIRYDVMVYVSPMYDVRVYVSPMLRNKIYNITDTSVRPSIHPLLFICAKEFYFTMPDEYLIHFDDVFLYPKEYCSFQIRK